MVLGVPRSMMCRARDRCGIAFVPVAADDSRDFFHRFPFWLGSRLYLDRVHGNLLRQIAVTRIQPVGFGQRLSVGVRADCCCCPGKRRLLLYGSPQADLERKESADADQATHSEPNGS